MPPIKNIQVDQELHHQVKLICVTRRITIREFTEAALRRALDGNGNQLLVDGPAPAYETEAVK